MPDTYIPRSLEPHLAKARGGNWPGHLRRFDSREKPRRVGGAGFASPRVHSLRSGCFAIAQLIVIHPRHLDVAGRVDPSERLRTLIQQRPR